MIIRAANQNDEDFQTGAQLLAAWGCKTREEKLERACIALMHVLNVLHSDHMLRDLSVHLNDPITTCSCADAFRMGHEAINNRNYP